MHDEPQRSPPLDVEAAARLALETHGIGATAEPLPGEYDDNFLLHAADGRRFVLKRMHRGADRGIVELQAAALAQLASAEPRLTLPRVIPATNGASIVEVVDSDGAPRLVWLLDYLPGRVLARLTHRPAALLSGVGRFLGALDRGLAGFGHPAARRELKWDLSRAAWALDGLEAIEDGARRELARRILESFRDEVAPGLPALRRSVIHNDANDHNVLVHGEAADSPSVAGLIDFGDMLEAPTVCEPAIAAAYALLDRSRPLDAVAAVVSGYHAEHPLTEEEIALLYPLVRTRLAVSVVNSALRKRDVPDDPYVSVSEGPAWTALERMESIHPRFAHYRLRAACGLEADPASATLRRALRRRTAELAPLLEIDPRTETCVVLDLSVGSLLLGASPAAAEAEPMQARIDEELRRAGARLAIGRYDEARAFYSGELFAEEGDPLGVRRTIHLGLDLFAAAGTAVMAPLAGRVHSTADNDAPRDYGPLVILEHELEEVRFHTLYGHLGRECLERLSPGDNVAAGETFARLGDATVNGGWAPHLHFQLVTDLLDRGTDFPGVARPDEREVWRSLCPDPNELAGVPATAFPEPSPSSTETLARRRRVLAPSLSLSYREPLKIVRGHMQFLYDDEGRRYLDAYNNVPHVGHGHPRVVEAIRRQAALLNTNTRYLHDNVVRYAERLTATLPEALDACFFVNSASEANELALRLARRHTGRRQLVVMRDAYHGHTGTLIDISPYKFAGPGGTGPPPWVHVAALPDLYRGDYRRDDPRATERYLADFERTVARAARGGLCGFIAETLPSVGGQIVPPPGYLAGAYESVRRAGGLCIADEVQVGFGRLGTHFWGFEHQQATPDIVVLGKPIANGHPFAAVVTRAEIARDFDGMEFFSTFGGNPVSCAAGLAVLDVLEDEGLQENARRVGERLLDGLRSLQTRHALIGDVRGSGLFLGVELVTDRGLLTPASDEAGYVVGRLRERGVLAGVDGALHNVLKLRPPMVFGEQDADLFLERLDEVLAELALPRRSVQSA